MIPKIIHYIWIDKTENNKAKLPKEFQMCLMSCKIFNPDYKIIIHTNKEFDWDLLKEEDFIISYIELNLLEEAKSIGMINDNYYSNIAHMSDWLRYNYLYDEGGIYLDTDIVVLSSFNDLLDKHFVVAKETPASICAGVILSEKNHPVVEKILNTYRNDYRIKEWVYNSQVKPYEYIKADPTCTVLDVEEGFHHPYIFSISKLLVPCNNISSIDDIHKYFHCRCHHLFAHIHHTKEAIQKFREATDEVYIAQVGKYILERYYSN